MEEDPIHLAVTPFVALCGSNVPNQRTSALGNGTATCPACVLLHPDADAWNARYLCYAAAHRREPEAQLAHDRLRYRGGSMTGYITWIGEQTRVYRALARDVDFDAWLKTTAARGKPNVSNMLRRAARAIGRERSRDPDIERVVQGELKELADELSAQADAFEEAEQAAKAQAEAAK